MEILKAGDEVESVIEQHSNQIDDEMVDILDKRTRLAARFVSNNSLKEAVAISVLLRDGLEFQAIQAV